MATLGMTDPNKVMEMVPPYATWNPNRALAATYLMSGPTAGANGVPSSNFTVSLQADKAIQFDVLVTMADSSNGAFTPSTLTLSDTERSKTFTYTPGSTGSKAISVTNNRNLENPPNITYVSS